MGDSRERKGEYGPRLARMERGVTDWARSVSGEEMGEVEQDDQVGSHRLWRESVESNGVIRNNTHFCMGEAWTKIGRTDNSARESILEPGFKRSSDPNGVL